MKVIIPIAGIGKRLRPLTYSVPKPLIPVAGKPILGHILESLKEFGEFVFVVNYMKNEIKEWVKRFRIQNSEFKIQNIHWVEQQEMLGLGHAVWLTKEIVRDDDILIVYGDNIFSTKVSRGLSLAETLQKAIDTKLDGCIGVQEVDNPRQLGIVELSNGWVSKVIEKPEHPTTNLAIVGVNFIHNTPLLFDCLNQLISEGLKTKGEFQLTDGIELMLERGARFKTFEIKECLDCGKRDTILYANRELLSKCKVQSAKFKVQSARIIPPVSIHEGVLISHSIVGPYVSIDRGSMVTNSIISDSIIVANTRIEDLLLSHSLIGSSKNIKMQNAKIKNFDI